MRDGDWGGGGEMKEGCKDTLVVLLHSDVAECVRQHTHAYTRGMQMNSNTTQEGGC